MVSVVAVAPVATLNFMTSPAEYTLLPAVVDSSPLRTQYCQAVSSPVTVVDIKSLKLPAFTPIVTVAPIVPPDAEVTLRIAFVIIHDFPTGTVYRLVCQVDFMSIQSTVHSFASDGMVIEVLILFFRK